MPVVIGLSLIAYASYILLGIYPDVLITAQDRNVFVNGSHFFGESLSAPFGLFQYVGSFLTQLFYHPSLGAGVLLAIWTSIVLVGIKAFRLCGLWRWLMIIPAACLMASVLDLGYWIYCLMLPGYWFSNSVAYLCLVLLLWGASLTPRRYRIVWHLLIGIAAFPLLGWYSYFFTISLCLLQFAKGSKPSWLDVVGIILSFVAPLVFHAVLYKGIPMNDVYAAGFPFFTTSTDESLRPSIPFFVLVGITLLLSLSGLFPSLGKKSDDATATAPAEASSSKNITRKMVSPVFGIIVSVLSAYAVWNAMFKDDNYLYEMQMTQATMSDDWQSVIKVAEQADNPSRTMVMLKNIALMNVGELGERSFELGNNGAEINNPDSLNVNIMQIASPVIYYNYGKVNYAMRWSMEFAVNYDCFSPYYLRNLIRCAESTGEKKLSRRYIDRLHRTMFYSDWQPAKETAIVKELRTRFADALDSDDNSCERYLITMFSKSAHVKSPILSDLGVLYSMILRDPKSFWKSFYCYELSHKGKKLPKNYEEAYCLFSKKYPVNLPIQVSISPEVEENFRAFMEAGSRYANMGFSEEGVADALKDTWGDTYWWFNAFGRNTY